jgi:hypothetical protein
MLNAQTRTNNHIMLDGLTSKDPYVSKEARSTLDDYLHLRVREDGLFPKILPQTNVSWDDCDNQVDTIMPVIIREMEPTSTAAIGLPFGGVPSNMYMGAPRYRVLFDRNTSDRYTADVMNLRGYTMDIRQVFNDIMLTDMLHEEDRKYFALVDSLCGTVNVGSGTRFDAVGTKGYIQLGGVINRATVRLLSEGLVATSHKLDGSKIVMNQRTAKQIIELDRTAAGGDSAERTLIDGVSVQKLAGYDLIITNKTDLVVNNDVYMFAAPEYLGDNLVLEDLTVSIKNEDYMFEMFAHKCCGGALRNMGAFCRASFSGSSAGSW